MTTQPGDLTTPQGTDHHNNILTPTTPQQYDGAMLFVIILLSIFTSYHQTNTDTSIIVHSLQLLLILNSRSLITRHKGSTRSEDHTQMTKLLSKDLT